MGLIKMKKQFKASITFMVSKNHPDIQYVKYPEKALQYNDVYTIIMWFVTL